MRRIFLVLALLLAPLGAEAIDDTCHFTGSGNWSSATAYSGTKTCTGGSTTLDANDAIVIDSGVVATITGDVTQGSGASIGITVSSGGTLTTEATPGSGLGVTKTVRLGDLGLDCQSGSVCTLIGGGYKQPYVASPALQPTLAAAGQWFVGDVNECPGDSGVCAGSNANTVRIQWPAASYRVNGSGTVGNNHIGDFLNSGTSPAVAVGDIACFGDVDYSDAYSFPDANFCYQVTARAGYPTYSVDLAMRQSYPDASARSAAGYSLALRTIKASTVQNTSGVAAGATTVEVANTVVSADRELQGRWIRFSDGTAAEPFAYKILRTENNPTDCSGGSGACDRITIGDLRGWQSAYPNGRAVWIDYGWSRGDPIYFYAPLVITSATASETDSPIWLRGTYTLKMAVLAGLGYGSGSQATVNIDTTAVQGAAMEDVWISDPMSAIGSSVVKQKSPLATFRRLSKTGGTSGTTGCPPGSPNVCVDYNHGIIFGPGTNNTIEDLGWRHVTDDVVVPSDPSDTGSSVTGRRWIAQFTGANNDSGSLFDAGTASVSLNLVDAECDDCTSPNQAGPPDAEGRLFDNMEKANSTMSGILDWGSLGGLECGRQTSANSQSCTDVMGLGLNGRITVLGGNMTNVVARDIRPTATNSAIGFIDSSASNENKLLNVKNGLIVGWYGPSGNSTGLGFPDRSDETLTLDNVLIVDPDSAASSFTLFNSVGSANGGKSLLKRVGLLWTKAVNPTTYYAFSCSGGTAIAQVTLQGLFATGLNSGGTRYIFTQCAPNTSNRMVSIGTQYFWNNTLDIASGQDENYSNIMRGVPPGMLEQGRGVYVSNPSTKPGDVNVGPDWRAGITRLRWMHTRNHLRPENAGSYFAPGGGGGGAWTPRAY